jgi:hypothetical protein
MESSSHRELLRLEEQFLSAPRRRLFRDAAWADDVPSSAGVYTIYDTQTDRIVYVGQTSDLRARFSDLGRWPNHTFRRKASKLLGVAKTAGDRVLSEAMAQRYEIAYLPVAFGRAELEEYLILRHQTHLENKPAKRLLKGEQYRWVEALPR